MSARPTDRAGPAILISLVALLLFELMGLVIKHLISSYSAQELSVYRNIFGLVPSVLALWSARAWQAKGRPWRIRQWPLALFRGFVVTGAQFLFYLSLAHLAFATASTLTYSNALFMTALAIPVLGEKVGLVRWSAVLVGFAGVVWVTGFGSDTFQWVALAPIGAAFLYALSGVTARLVDDDVPSPLLNLYSTGASATGALVFTLSTTGFSPIGSATDMAWILAMGCLGGCAVLCLVISFRMTEQSNLAPFSYFGIPMAFILGWVFYNEAPWSDLFPGAVLIVAGGLLVIWRERRLRAKS